ncbi:MAG: hypothetical protein ACNS60_15950 [Candidatus Cyclobacteriaceae bacterium M2_1C_046]
MKNLKYFTFLALFFGAMTFSCNEDIISPGTGGDDDEDDPVIIIGDSTSVLPHQNSHNY